MGFQILVYLEYCNLENLLEREQFYFNKLKPEYNIVKKAGSTLGYKHSEESLKRDFILSDEILVKKKLATKNATLARSISILVKNIKTGEKLEYKSMSEAANALGVTKGAVYKRILKKTYIITKLK